MDLAQRTLALCEIPSPIGEEARLADHVEAWAKALAPEVDVKRVGHSLAVGAFEDPRPMTLLVGHLDTVPAHPGDQGARIADGRVYGLGSTDMKGGLAVMMALFESPTRASWPVNLCAVFYEREEGPYQESGLGPILEQVPALTKARFGIALEPTGNVVQVGCVGSIHATLRFNGKSAHSARPWQGENAIHKAGALLAELNGRPRREVKFDGYTFFEVFSVTKAEGGRARNVVPEAFELNLNYRFAPGKSLERAQADVRDLVAGRAEIAFTDLAPSGRVCLDNPQFQRFLQVTGLPAESKQAWTDVARLSAMGIDAVNFGPGDPAQAHQANESAPIDALEVAYQRLGEFLSR